MIYRLAADATLVLHLGFILFACIGAILATKWRWLPVIHLPAASWGVYIELAGKTCPLTHLENHCRRFAGQSGYHESFLEHYLLALIYPGGLTREVQYLLAAFVLLLNIVIYGWLIHRRTRKPSGA